MLSAIDRFLCERIALTSRFPRLWHSIRGIDFGCVRLRAIETALMGFVLRLEAQQGEVACSRLVFVEMRGRRQAVWDG